MSDFCLETVCWIQQILDLYLKKAYSEDLFFYNYTNVLTRLSCM